MKYIECTPKGVWADYLDIITERQLTDTSLWEHCVGVFGTGIDNRDGGWRGEYWGKMMRGACLVYTVTRSEKLMQVLTGAVDGLLAKQEESGRISTYRSDEEFFGWDVWSRKYVMTGLQHYYDICPDEKRKEKIMTALTAHADYIVDRIGGVDGKLGILETGQHWGGVNSASILEPFVRLYRDTEDKRYLDFAEYIISTGGCRDGNLIDHALNGTDPYLFPEQKAYETMSFFEGVLAYYEVTGDKTCLAAVKKFTDSLLSSDITVIGSCGCTEELFDHSAVRQTEYTGKIMQETCVTVTLIRFLSRMFAVTGERRLTDVICRASFNALAGALNINGYEQFCYGRYVPGLLFDSYSPLCDSKRGMGIGGYKEFADGRYFGCCACIASAGFALAPLMSVTEYLDGIRINYLMPGSYRTASADLEVENDRITVTRIKRDGFRLYITTGDAYTLIAASADGKVSGSQDGYTVIGGVWHDGDSVTLTVKKQLIEQLCNGKVTLNYGGYVLAADTAKTDRYRPGEPVAFERSGNGDIVYTLCEPQDREQVRLTVKTRDGDLVLTDYAAAGQDGKSTLTVWFVI